MKNAKRLLALMLALSLVFALTACGSEPKKGSVTLNDKTSTPAPASTPENTPEPEPENTPEPEPENTPEPEPEDDVELGSMNGGTYANSFVGIGCKLDDTWTYYSEEEILEFNGLMVDSIGDEDLADMLRKSNIFYDMVASSETGSSVNVVLENIGLIYGHVLDSSSYVDIALESLEGQLALMGVTATTCEKTSFDFCGKKTDGIYIAGTLSAGDIEVDMYQLMACVKAGNYMTCITACTYYEDTTADILDMFYAL